MAEFLLVPAARYLIPLGKASTRATLLRSATRR